MSSKIQAPIKFVVTIFTCVALASALLGWWSQLLNKHLNGSLGLYSIPLLSYPRDGRVCPSVSSSQIDVRRLGKLKWLFIPGLIYGGDDKIEIEMRTERRIVKIHLSE